MNVTQLLNHLEKGALDARLLTLYEGAQLPRQRARYQRALLEFKARFGEREDTRIFSVPGRSELLGNHTDHNGGLIIAAAVDPDIIAVAAPTEQGLIQVKSEGYPEDVVDISAFTAPDPRAFGTSRALIAGVCHGLAKNTHRVGGFVAYTTSNVPTGAGLSSSAAFEVLIATVQNHLYNNGTLSCTELAHIAQFAENAFFDKPCGLMDQLACATGGASAVDFEQSTTPAVEKLTLDLATQGYRLCVVNTRGSHADLTADYAAVPAEMHAVAKALGKNVLREVDENALTGSIAALRATVGDRAILRALHFFAENRRVRKAATAISHHDLESFLGAVRESGQSSYCYLQNAYAPAHPESQGISLALCLSERYLSPKGGAWRVHGGGFAGTVLAVLKDEDLEGFTAMMNAVFGKNACTVLNIRPQGAVAII